MPTPLLFTGELHRDPLVLDLASRVELPPRLTAYILMELWQWGLEHAGEDGAITLAGLGLLHDVIPEVGLPFWLSALNVGLIRFNEKKRTLTLLPGLIIPGEETGPVYG